MVFKMKIADGNSFTSLLACVAACSVAGLFSGLHWFFDLFNHFRPQAIVAGVILLLPMLILKNRRFALFAVAVILLNAALIAGRIYAFSKNSTTDAASYAAKSISVISANVETSNTNYAGVTNLIKERQPDIFVALEVDDMWVGHLKEIEAAYPYTLKHPRQDNFGMAVYSKIPFKGTVLEIGDYELPLFLMNFKNFALMTTHPIPPASRKNAEETRRYISEVALTASKTRLPLIVAGDMNATLWSDNIRPFIAAGLTPANPTGIAWTWPSNFLPFAIEIDHIFVRNALVRAFKVLGNTGSDHYPVEALISLPESK